MVEPLAEIAMAPGSDDAPDGSDGNDVQVDPHPMYTRTLADATDGHHHSNETEYNSRHILLVIPETNKF